MDILIIEDDQLLRKALSYHLLENGHTVCVAGNGLEAVSLIKKGSHLDAIICDVLMPELSGPGFLLMLKRYFPQGLPYIMVMSVLKDGEHFVNKLHIPCDLFISKPIDFVKLDKALEELAARGRVSA